jgi:hypothetical protein
MFTNVYGTVVTKNIFQQTHQQFNDSAFSQTACLLFEIKVYFHKLY